MNETEIPVLKYLNNLPNVELTKDEKESVQGRAAQMNAGAKQAKGEFLWFLHSDSKFADDTFSELQKAIAKYPDKLHYFKLSFYDGDWRMRITEIFANLRAKFLGIPFGDQGFCISKKNFETLDGYSETAPYGEDHLLVWKAKQSGIKLNKVGAILYTSARKYKRLGWLKVSIIHQYLWIKQAIPEAIKLMRKQ